MSHHFDFQSLSHLLFAHFERKCGWDERLVCTTLETSFSVDKKRKKRQRERVIRFVFTQTAPDSASTAALFSLCLLSCPIVNRSRPSGLDLNSRRLTVLSVRPSQARRGTHPPTTSQRRSSLVSTLHHAPPRFTSTFLPADDKFSLAIIPRLTRLLPSTNAGGKGALRYRQEKVDANPSIRKSGRQKNNKLPELERGIACQN